MTETRPAWQRPALHHRLRPMRGRDTTETHRAATPLELLFDLTFVVAFGQAADEMAHYLAAGHIAPALLGFGFALFGICWAWINFSWFASAFDTDDWFFRVATMVQMIGVLVLALGLPRMFGSIDGGTVFDNEVMVAGYIIMRVAMLAQWLRVARQDATMRGVALSYAFFIATAQTGWVLILVLREAPLPVLVLAIAITLVLDIGGPSLSERFRGKTPWNAHHIAERYSLLLIIALGEGIFGTIATVSAIVSEGEWSTEAIIIIVAGVGLTFALWWIYFVMPSGLVLDRHRGRAWIWGYVHVLLFGSVTATGAGLHVAAYVVEGHAHLGTLGAVLSVAVPVFGYLVVVFALFAYLVHHVDPFHIGLMAGSTALLVLAVVLAASGVSLGICLLVIVASPVLVVVGYETVGYRHEEDLLARALA